MTTIHDTVGPQETEWRFTKVVVAGLIILSYLTAIVAFLIPIVNYMLVVG